MTNAELNTLTDWIGIPLVIVLIVAIVAVDLRSVAGRRPRVAQLVVGTISLVWVVAVVLFRFVELA